MEELTQPTGLWAGIGMGITGFVAGALMLFKKLSDLSVDRAGDRAEVHIIEVLQTENAKMRELLERSDAEKREYFQKFMEASTQVALLTKEVALLNEQMSQNKIVMEEMKLSIAHLSQELEKRQ